MEIPLAALQYYIQTTNKHSPNPPTLLHIHLFLAGAARGQTARGPGPGPEPGARGGGREGLKKGG